MRALTLATCLLLAACGGVIEDSSGGGDGGSAGAGGTGGATGGAGGATGGAGGATGGAGGSVVAVCGDGALDAGEGCDDGGLERGDGCDATCVVEPGCGAPIDLAAVATRTGAELSVEGDFGLATLQQEGSCGGPGHEVVYRWVADAAGLLQAQVDSDKPLRLYARSSCADAATEQLCVATATTAELEEVQVGDELFFVVDAQVVDPIALFTLKLRVLPYAQLGDRCGDDARCVLGTRCAFNECRVNTAPTNGAILAVRGGASGGNDFVLRYEGHDPDADVIGFWIRFENPAGAPAAAIDTEGDGIADSAEIVAGFMNDVSGLVDFEGTIDAAGFFAAARVQVSQVRVALVDSGNLRSEELVVPLSYWGPRNQGQACDVRGLANYCNAPYACVEGTCQ